FVNHLRQKFGQEVRRLVRIKPHFCRQRFDLVGTQTFLNLIAGDGLVFAHADPGGKCAAAAALRKFIGQALQSPALRQETTQNSDKRIRFAGSVSFSASCTEYRVEKSHSFIAPLVDCRILNVFYKTVFEERARRKGYFPVRTNAKRQVLW